MSLAADAEPRNAHEARQKDKILNLLQRGKVLGTTLAWEIAISTNLALLGQPAGGQPAGFEALLKAAREGKRRRVRALLNAGVDPNAHDTYGLTAAHHAAGAGFKNILRELAAHGADFSLADKFGNDVAAQQSPAAARLGRWVSRQQVDGGQPVSPAISAITETSASPARQQASPAKPETSAAGGRNTCCPPTTAASQSSAPRIPAAMRIHPTNVATSPAWRAPAASRAASWTGSMPTAARRPGANLRHGWGNRDKLVSFFDQPIASAPDPDAQESLCAALDGALALDMTSVAADYEEIMQHIQAARPDEPDAGGTWIVSLERLSAFASNCQPLAGADQFADEFAGEPAGVMGNSLELAFSV